ncbi:glycine-rich domain-containing protein [Burkholderia multivorans]|uniref:glycine-rich domain-containing protein n=1 Tax=Burkholderia multivorans TaxID=87883 RepID=UPI001D113C25|nr:hypothetical protein [Burkholderia multivorans]
MATQNDFLPFATGPGANVVDQATYAALGALTTGFLSGTAQSVQLNKVWRQSSIVAAVIAQFIVAQTGQAAVDDGTTATLLANFTKAVNAASKQRVILPDSGSVNAYAAANPVPMTSLPTVGGIVQTISVKTTNTGASTYSPDGLPSRPIYGLGGAALQGGELVANGIATLVSYVGPLLNGGSLCWVLFECIGGAQQVAPATQSQHAMQLGQATGRLLRTSVYTNVGGTQYVSVNGGSATTTGATSFTALAATTAVEIECQGGGGGGGGVSANGTSPAAAGGAGAGSYGRGRYTSGFSSLTITVGAGGAGAAAGNNYGSGGGTSSAGSLLSAPGGVSGAGGAPTTAPFFNGGSNSGSAPTGANLYAVTGSPGMYGIVLGNDNVAGGVGGSSMFGAAPPPVSNTSGNSAVNYGAGGGGASANSALNINQGGGAGAGGIVIIREYA